ncbi:MAG: hypothetical protein ACTSRS_20730 [Candidatus Helarchaeota archaeon]
MKFIRGVKLRKLSVAQIRNQIGDLTNLSHILVIYKRGGIAIFSQNFGYEHLDATLLSGLLDAINTLGTSIGAKGKLRRLEYEKYQIIIHDGKKVRGIIMCRQKPSSFLEDALTIFIKKFENKYAGTLIDWDNDITPFQTAVELVDECFSTALIYPMVVMWEGGEDDEELSELERKILEITKEVCLEKECFLIPDILEILKEKLNKSPDRLLALLYDLHKRQYFISLT